MKICIIGGGTAGWWCAAYMNKFLDAEITLIESNDIPILGVGESSLPQIKTFFDAIKLEKTMLLILMMLIVLVATFNILSSLFMVVSERKEDIAILKTLGLYSSDVTKIFIYQGMLLSLVGVFFGVIFGLIISYNLDVIISIIEYAKGD